MIDGLLDGGSAVQLGREVQGDPQLVWQVPTPYGFRDDRVAWIPLESLREGCGRLSMLPCVVKRVDALVTRLEEQLIDHTLKQEPWQFAIYNSGSAGYASHRDEEPEDVNSPNGRLITCTIYLTDIDGPGSDDEWSFGGHLRVWPRGGGGGWVDVAPVPGRAVVLLSGVTWHQVQPWRHPTLNRIAATVFLH